MQERGFSLIELLIVVAIILVIAAIAIPSLLHSKIAANEASAVYSIRTINTAQVTYATTYPASGYASILNMLAAPATGEASSANAGVLDWVLGCTTTVCPKSGYNFQLYNVQGSPTISSYDVSGVPITIGITGYRGFCSDSTNFMTFDPNGGTTCTETLQ
jgi:type IV pilus assembly protein PilA